MAMTAKHLIEFIKNAKGFDKFMRKLKIINIEKGSCVAEMKVEEEHTNMMGGLHGGFSATLVDQISSYALLTLDKGAVPSVSVDIHMTYCKGAKLGDEIVIDARTLKCGQNLAFLEVDIKHKATNELIAKGAHTKYLLRGEILK